MVVVLSSDLPSEWSVSAVTQGGRSILDDPLALELNGISDVRISLSDQGPELRGVVRTTGGVADPDATVLVFPEHPEHRVEKGNYPLRLGSTRVSADGGYSIRRLPPGDYLAIAIRDEFTFNWQAEDRLAQLARQATRVTLPTGGPRVLDLQTATGK
jgi:hypothetical protein